MRLPRPTRLLPLGTLLACSSPATETDAPPTATITSPADLSSVQAGARVLLQGFALDAAEAGPSLTARWFVDDLEVCQGIAPANDGAVECEITASSGSSIEVRLEVTDAAGQAAVTSITLTVTPATAENLAPTCAFSVEAGSSVAGELVALTGTVGDPDGTVERLTVQWVGDRDGELGTSTPTSVGEVACATGALGVGLQTVQMTVTDPGGATCTDSIPWTVLVPPTIDVDLPVAGTIALNGDALTFFAEVSDADSTADELLVTWESDLDGVFYEVHALPSGIVAFETTGLSPGTHSLTVTVTDPSGLQAIAVSNLTVDTAPTAPGVSLTPADPTTHDTLVVSIDTPATDPDGDALTYLYAWTVDGVASSASASSTLPASATTAGEVWTVAVAATDGFATSAVGTASVTLLSSGPVVTAMSVTPTSAAVGQTLTCAGSAEDADRGALSPTYVWSTGAVGTMLVLTAAQDPGDVVSCTVTATTDDGAVATASAGAVVVNTLPTISPATVSPAVVEPGAAATCSASGADADGDTPTVTYAWSTGATGATLVVDTSAVPGSQLTCTAAATDPDGGAATSSASTTVYATPTISGLTLSPDPLYTDDLLTASATVSDADAEPVTLTWDWYVDGALVQSGPDDSLDGATSFDRDQDVQVVLTADDGTTAVEASAELPVENSAPSTPGPASLLGAEGVDLTCSVATASTDADGDAITYTFTWELDGSSYGGATSDGTSSTVPGAEVVGGQEWSCRVLADDGTLTSPSAERVTLVGGDCSAWSIDGTDSISQAEIPYDSALNLTSTPFTIEEWAYFETLTPPEGVAWAAWASLTNHLAALVDAERPSADGWKWKVYPDGRMEFGYGSRSASGAFVTSGSGSVLAGVWTHLAVTFDGSTYRLWADGAQVASAAGSAPTWGSETDPVAIGSFGDSAFYYAAQFSIAAARFSSKVRYTGTFSPEPTWPVDADTIAQWDFGASGGAGAETDLSGNGHEADSNDLSWINEGPSCL